MSLRFLPLLVGTALVALFLGILIGYAWHRSTSQVQPAAARDLPPAGVDVEVLRPGPMPLRLASIGVLRPLDEVTLRSLVSGLVSEVGFSDGEAVSEGQVLVRIHDAETRQLLAAALAARNEAQRRLDRSRELLESGLSTSEERERLAADLEAAEARVAALQAQLDEYVVRAPFPGRVGLRAMSPGATVSQGDALVTVTRLDPLRIATTIPERFLGMLRDGIQVEGESPAFPGQSFHGEVVFFAPTIDAATRSLRIEANIPNDQQLLRPGQTLNVRATLGEDPDVLTIPEESVILRGNQASVWVLRDGRAIMQGVELGRVDGGRIEVRSGLKAGDQVVVRGIQSILFPGMPARVRNGAAGPPGAAPAPPASEDEPELEAAE
ncbi:MAG: efflux RND transporter periplasmic adaptor subunit [Planctomycetota bacterium]|nr:MAG: efflux RND transporter periplasmic adaptor subunit [Planctomycetota bacterium]